MYYVKMKDTFMSGWGKASKKTNILVIECKTADEADIVADNARARSEMKYVAILRTKPKYKASTHLVQYKTKADMPRWFEKGAFTR